MPSGAKKRKAAKKKMENQSKGASVHGDEDVKVEEDISSAEGSRNDENCDNIEKIGVVEEGVVQVERDFKKDNGKTENFEAEGMKKMTYNGGSCSSRSSTGSDDENCTMDNKNKITEPIKSSVMEMGGVEAVSPQISSSAVPCAVDASSVDNTATSYDPKKPENGTGHGVTEPLLVPSSRPVQKTSWMSCCGLLDAFSG